MVKANKSKRNADGDAQLQLIHAVTLLGILDDIVCEGTSDPAKKFNQIYTLNSIALEHVQSARRSMGWD